MDVRESVSTIKIVTLRLFQHENERKWESHVPAWESWRGKGSKGILTTIKQFCIAPNVAIFEKALVFFFFFFEYTGGLLRKLTNMGLIRFTAKRWTCWGLREREWGSNPTAAAPSQPDCLDVSRSDHPTQKNPIHGEDTCGIADWAGQSN